jgi:hypothetical protein
MQMTKLIDILEDCLEKRGFKVLQLDGHTKSTQRSNQNNYLSSPKLHTCQNLAYPMQMTKLMDILEDYLE